MNDKIRKRFPFFNKNSKITYLDSAASSLKLDKVIKKINNYYLNNGSNISRGIYKLAHEATQDFEDTRKVISKFINCNFSEIIFTSGTTDSLNKLARSYAKNINEGDEIITSILEHHSLLVPWQIIAEEKKAIIKYVDLDELGRITIDNFKKVLSNKTKVVALSYVSNILGHKIPIAEIIKLAHEFKAIVIIDAAQAVSHIEIDVKKLDVDFLAFSAHKIYGPNGVGVLFGKKELLEKLEPFNYGGQMTNIVNLKESTFKEIPYKFEAGTPAIAEIIAFKYSLLFLKEIGFKKIIEHEMKLKNYILEKMKLIKEITIYNEISDSSIITFNINGFHPHDVITILDTKNVCIRAGNHCAQLVSNFINVDSTLRASLAIYNNYEDCDNFIDALNYTIDFFKNI